MPVTFQGLKNVGKRHAGPQGQNPAISKATLSWLIQVLTADGNFTQITVPNLGVINGWKFTLDPTSVQSSFTFGDVKALLYNISRPVDNVEGDITHGYHTGSTFIYVVSSGQLFRVGPNIPIVVTNAGAVNNGQMVKCGIVPCDGIQPGIIDIFIEADNFNGVLQNPPNYAALEVIVTAFNYDVPPVAIQ